MSKIPTVFISGPLKAETKGQVETNISVAEHYANLLWLEGFFVLCPHMNSGKFLGLLDESHVIESYTQVVKLFDAIFMLPNWETSEGAVCEQTEAHRVGTLVYTDLNKLISELGRDER